MQVLESEHSGCFDNLHNVVVESILAPPASSIQLVKSWLLELFVRGTVPINPAGIKKLEVLSSPLDKRQLHLIKGRIGDKNFFRKNKTAFGQLSAFEQPCFVWGASCLPKDEYESWLSAVKPMFAMPTGASFLKWAGQQQSTLIGKLDSATDDHQE
jgi:hypothetical protein